MAEDEEAKGENGSWEEDKMWDGDEEKDYSCEVKDDGASRGEEMWKAEEARGRKQCTGLQVEVPCERAVKAM